jgi:hypothetical protein
LAQTKASLLAQSNFQKKLAYVSVNTLQEYRLLNNKVWQIKQNRTIEGMLPKWLEEHKKKNNSVLDELQVTAGLHAQINYINEQRELIAELPHYYFFEKKAGRFTWRIVTQKFCEEHQILN